MQAQPSMYAPEGFKAVCYRCSYETREHGELRCPVCRFPVILEPETTPPGGRQIEGILKRPTVESGALPLPGVHADKRSAQLRAESRKRRESERLDARREQTKKLTAEVASRRIGGTSVTTARRLMSRATFAILCVSAVAAGALAAVLQHGV